MKLLPISLALLGTASAQTWSIRFWGRTDCTPESVPLQQAAGTSAQGCHALSTRNGISTSFKFNGANAFKAEICTDASCTSCLHHYCYSNGNGCVTSGRQYLGFRITRDDTCQRWRLG